MLGSPGNNSACGLFFSHLLLFLFFFPSFFWGPVPFDVLSAVYKQMAVEMSKVIRSLGRDHEFLVGVFTESVLPRSLGAGAFYRDT